MALRKQPSLEDVQEQFTKWRATRQRRSRIPEKLWSAAVELTEQYSINKISKALQVNYSTLKNKAALHTQEKTTPIVPHPCFLELPLPQSPSQSECLIEMENRHGEKIRMHFSSESNLDLLVLWQNFWARRS